MVVNAYRNDDQGLNNFVVQLLCSKSLYAINS